MENSPDLEIDDLQPLLNGGRKRIIVDGIDITPIEKKKHIIHGWMYVSLLPKLIAYSTTSIFAWLWVIPIFISFYYLRMLVSMPWIFITNLCSKSFLESKKSITSVTPATNTGIHQESSSKKMLPKEQHMISFPPLKKQIPWLNHDTFPMESFDAMWALKSGRNSMVINAILIFEKPLDRDNVIQLGKSRFLNVKKYRRFSQRIVKRCGIYYWVDTVTNLDRHVVELKSDKYQNQG